MLPISLKVTLEIQKSAPTKKKKPLFHPHHLFKQHKDREFDFLSLLSKNLLETKFTQRHYQHWTLISKILASYPPNSPHHSPSKKPPRSQPKPQKATAHSFILRIFHFLVDQLKPLYFIRYHGKRSRESPFSHDKNKAHSPLHISLFCSINKIKHTPTLITL